MTGTTTTGGTTGSTSYTYDAAGNTQTRNTSTGDQTLLWNNTEQLTSVSNSTTGTATSYIYDADGNLLLQVDPSTTTLYLGSEQITLNDSAWHRHWRALLQRPRRHHHRPHRYRHQLRLRTRRRPARNQQSLSRLHRPDSHVAPVRPLRQPSRHNHQLGRQPHLSKQNYRYQYWPHRYRRSRIRSHYGPLHQPRSRTRSHKPPRTRGYTYAGDNPVSESDPTGLCMADICGVGTPGETWSVAQAASSTTDLSTRDITVQATVTTDLAAEPTTTSPRAEQLTPVTRTARPPTPARWRSLRRSLLQRRGGTKNSNASWLPRRLMPTVAIVSGTRRIPGSSGSV